MRIELKSDERIGLSLGEQQHILSDLSGLVSLISYHNDQECGADSRGADEASKAHSSRIQELKEIGRAIIKEDPEIWPDNLIVEFK